MEFREILSWVFFEKEEPRVIRQSSVNIQVALRPMLLLDEAYAMIFHRCVILTMWQEEGRLSFNK